MPKARARGRTRPGARGMTRPGARARPIGSNETTDTSNVYCSDLSSLGSADPFAALFFLNHMNFLHLEIHNPLTPRDLDLVFFHLSDAVPATYSSADAPAPAYSTPSSHSPAYSTPAAYGNVASSHSSHTARETQRDADEPYHQEDTDYNPAVFSKWTVEEEVVLLKNWINVSEDCTVGNHQKREFYWRKIIDVCNDDVDVGAKFKTRTFVAVKKHFQDVNTILKTFSG